MNKNKNTVKPNCYPFAEEMLNTIRIEYNFENERKRMLDTKAYTFITLNIALITLFLPLIPLKEIKIFYISSCNIGKSFLIYGLILLGINIIILVVSFVILVKAASISRYNSVQLDAVLKYSENEKEYDITLVQQGLVEHYYEILVGKMDNPGNITLNDKRAKKIRQGMILTVIGYLMLFLLTIILRIFII